MSKVELESRRLLFGSVTLLEGKIMIWNNIDLAEGLALLSANGYWLKGTSAKPLKRLSGTNKVVWYHPQRKLVVMIDHDWPIGHNKHNTVLIENCSEPLWEEIQLKLQEV